MRLKAHDEIHTMHSFAQLCNQTTGSGPFNEDIRYSALLLPLLSKKASAMDVPAPFFLVRAVAPEVQDLNKTLTPREVHCTKMEKQAENKANTQVVSA